MTISKEQLLQPAPTRIERVDLPELGADAYVMIHGLNAAGMNRHNTRLMKKDWTGVNPQMGTIQKELLIIECARDDDGKRLFTGDDIHAMGQWSHGLLDRLYDKAIELSGETASSEEEDTDAAKN